MRIIIVNILILCSFVLAVLCFFRIGVPYTTTFASVYCVAYLIGISGKKEYTKSEKISKTGCYLILFLDLIRFFCYLKGIGFV